MLLCRGSISVPHRVPDDAVKARHPRNQIKPIVTLSEKPDYATMGFQSPRENVCLKSGLSQILHSC